MFLLRPLVVLLLLAAAPLPAEPAGDLSRRWAVYGQGLASQGKVVEAGAAFDKAISLDPGSAAAYEARGRFLWKQGKAVEAKADLRRAVDLDATRTALAAWLEALESAPGEPAGEADHSEDLLEAQSLLDGGDAAGALPLFEQGAKGAWSPGAAWALGQVQSLYALGRFNEAREALSTARKRDPNDPALLRLQERYFHAGLDEDRGGGSPWGAMLRSAVLPGWGQAYNGQGRRGLTVGAVTLGLLGATVATYVAAGQAADEYRALGPGTPAGDFDAAFGRADGLAIANQAVGLCFYAAYAFNVMDAAVQARPAPRPAAGASGPRVTLLALSF